MVVLEGDCRELLASLPEGTFDACIADPPYGDTSLNWDRIVHGWIPAVARVLKPASSIWIFGSMRHFASLRIFAQMRRCGFRYSQDIVWEKQNGTGFHADRFRRVHEHAVLFYRGAWGDVYHATQYTSDATAKIVLAKKRPAHTGHIDKIPYISFDGGPRLARSVMQVRNEHGRAKHPTQKPVKLLEPLVQYSCPFGGSVLVPFGGVGSEGVACVNTGRVPTICEVDPDFVAEARTRLAEAAEGVLW